MVNMKKVVKSVKEEGIMNHESLKCIVEGFYDEFRLIVTKGTEYSRSTLAKEKLHYLYKRVSQSLYMLDDCMHTLIMEDNTNDLGLLNSRKNALLKLKVGIADRLLLL